MKKLFLFFLLVISVVSLAQVDKVVPPKPAVADGLVHDYTKTLTPEQESYLENKLVTYDNSSSNQIAVVIISSLKGNSVEDVGLEILRKWGVGGQAEADNGIVLLVAKDDRKVRIEVGYGLEGAITDYTASTIIETNIVPNFKSGNFYRGIDEAIDKIIEAAAGRYQAPEGYGKNKRGLKFWQIMLMVFVVWIVLAIISGGKGGGGGYVSRRGYRGWWGGPTWGGGGWSGGGWSGGGGGGGFGGFGGGSGGGGGASGSW